MTESTERRLLRVAKCPACDRSGEIPRQISVGARWILRRRDGSADCGGWSGELCAEYEWEGEQCQWCDERNTLLAQPEGDGLTPETRLDWKAVEHLLPHARPKGQNNAAWQVRVSDQPDTSAKIDGSSPAPAAPLPAPASSTPRTDTLKIPSEALLLCGQPGVPAQIVKAIQTLGDHARQLERELEEAKQRESGLSDALLEAEAAQYAAIERERLATMRADQAEETSLVQTHLDNAGAAHDDGKARG